jgi:hypothetical protein
VGTDRSHGVGPFYRVLELANVAGPVIRQLPVQDGRGGSHNRTVEARGHVGQALIGQGQQIVLALAQRRYVPRDDLQPIVEILAKPMAAQVCAEVAVRRSQELNDSPPCSFLHHAHSGSVKAVHDRRARSHGASPAARSR